MSLFKDQDEIEIIFNCRVCFKEEKIVISATDYEEVEQFPIIKEFIHDIHPHKLILQINQNLEIENFTTEDIIETSMGYSEKLIKQALSDLNLNDEEIKLYFLSSGRDVVSLGEMALLIGGTKEECKEIAYKFVEKGLFKEIIGFSPHFAPLPPYAALVSQLKTFNSYISEIHTNAPLQLGESFSELETQTEGVRRLNEYAEFMREIKNNTIETLEQQRKDVETTIAGIEQIKDVASMISNLDNDTKILLDKQTENLTEQFELINTKVSGAIKEQFLSLIDEMMGVKTKISTNLQKLRLGVIQQTVDQVIDQVFTLWIKEMSESLSNQISDIEKITEKTLKDAIVDFFNQFIKDLRDNIANSVKKIDDVLDTTSKASGKLKNLFEGIDKNFSKAVILSEEKLEGITESIFSAFGNLKKTFSSQIIETLDKVLGNILQKLEVSEITTTEFWDQAKKTSNITMKDLWFIRSVEGAKAHINEMMTKVKSKILIIAPEITDIDIEAINMAKPHINIRVAASIDLSRADHVVLYEQLSNMPNVTFRHRTLQNIWGVNRDYEEVILCVISKSYYGGQILTEIAGIGSMVLEHIKIFVSSLEDAWLNAQKDILRSMKPAIGREVARKRAEIQGSPAPTPTSSPINNQKSTPAPVQVPKAPDLNPSPQQTPASELPLASSIPEQIPQSSPSSIVVDSNLTGDALLTNLIDTLMNNLENYSGAEAISGLTQFHNNLMEIRGYSAFLKQIKIGISSITNQGPLEKSEIDGLSKKVFFWRKKLKL